MFEFSQKKSELRQAITANYRRDEATAIADLLPQAQMSEAEKINAHKMARGLVEKLREDRRKASGVDALMQEFTLSSEEGVALMCLAEALLRIPDKITRQKLIKDKLAQGNWRSHINQSASLFVNAAAWGLLITGKLTNVGNEKTLGAALTRIIGKGGQPLINKGVDFAMKLLGKQFVTGETIEEALKNGAEREKMGYRFSFDMLGEMALTDADAQRYYQDYVQAIHAIGKSNQGRGIYDGNGISVKLSAIHPRYERAQYDRVMKELLPRLKALFLLAKQYQVGLNIDAEEASRLELSLDLMDALLSDPDLKDFAGIGFVVQAYQKRAPFVIRYLIDTARRNQRKMMIRLVKGAYWDSEIKWAQQDGLDGYPVYTRKVHTDVSYLACARILLDAQDVIFPQFATHNAYTLSAIYQMGAGKDFEFQGLHGMAETLYNQVVGAKNLNRRCRIYAPVGSHETLLAYLVRRLLENGANSSFVNQIVDDSVPIDDLIRCPLDIAAKTQGQMHPNVPLPRNLYGSRLNSAGLDLSNELTLNQLQEALNQTLNPISATPLTAVEVPIGATVQIRNPSNHDELVGSARFIQPEDVAAVVAAARPFNAPPAERAAILRRVADLLEENQPLLLSLAVREAGKTLKNAIGEVREAVDFCRYYADQLRDSPAQGIMVAISPWNFPLAIFVGEVIAGLAAGNAVIAKPAEQTPLIAYTAIQLMHQAGVPTDALQLVLGAGDVGAALTANPAIAGVIFTGSTEVARAINRALNRADGEALPSDGAPRVSVLGKDTALTPPANKVFIGETGGFNAMIVDSSALAEQVCVDVITSAFDSAGQRCSALRVLCLQEEIADKMLTMIRGAMDELVVGNPVELTTDIGAVIDEEARQNLLAHIERMKKTARRFHQLPLPALKGTFVAPVLFELNNLLELNQEVFGPVLHVIRYQSSELSTLIQQINAKGYALTHGIHSRLDSTITKVSAEIEAGNIYVNRNIIGAVVGVQPFGGHGLSGTGPKAGGPFYLQRLARGTWTLPELTTPPQADEDKLAALAKLLEVLDFNHEQRVRLAAAMGECRVHQLRGASALLHGYTGERNILSWKAPERVTLLGGDSFQAAEALIRLASTGTTVQIPLDHPLACWAEYASSVLQVRKGFGPVVVTLEPLSASLRQQLSAAEGPITKVIDASNGLDILPLFEEICVSVNTTATGGNASLMAEAAG